MLGSSKVFKVLVEKVNRYRWEYLEIFKNHRVWDMEIQKVGRRMAKSHISEWSSSHTHLLQSVHGSWIVPMCKIVPVAWEIDRGICVYTEKETHTKTLVAHWRNKKKSHCTGYKGASVTGRLQRNERTTSFYLLRYQLIQTTDHKSCPGSKEKGNHQMEGTPSTQQKGSIPLSHEGRELRRRN